MISIIPYATDREPIGQETVRLYPRELIQLELEHRILKCEQIITINREGSEK